MNIYQKRQRQHRKNTHFLTPRFYIIIFPSYHLTFYTASPKHTPVNVLLALERHNRVCAVIIISFDRLDLGQRDTEMEHKSRNCESRGYLENRRSRDGAYALHDDVEDSLEDADVPGDQEPTRDGRIDVASGHVTYALQPSCTVIEQVNKLRS